MSGQKKKVKRSKYIETRPTSKTQDRTIKVLDLFHVQMCIKISRLFRRTGDPAGALFFKHKAEEVYAQIQMQKRTDEQKKYLAQNSWEEILDNTVRKTFSFADTERAHRFHKKLAQYCVSNRIFPLVANKQNNVSVILTKDAPMLSVEMEDLIKFSEEISKSLHEE